MADDTGSVVPLPRPAARRRMLALLAATLVLAMSPWFSATAVLVPLQALWGFGNSLAAWLTIAVQLGFVAGALASALSGVADRVPLRRLIALSALGAALANALVLVVQSPVQLLLARLATGVFLAGVYPPALKLISTWFARGRGLAIGVLIGAITVGSALPHLVNAFGGARWELVVAVTSAATLAGSLVAAVLLREGPFPFPLVRLRFADAGAVLRNPAVVRASLGYFGHMWELYAMWAWFATFALGSAAIGGSLRGAALLAFVVIAVGLLGCIAGGIAGDRIGRARTASIALLVSGGCCVLAGFVHQGPAWTFVAFGLLWGVSVIADSAQFSALVTERGDPRFVGTALALQLGLGFLLTAATIWILPLLAAHLGSWQWVFLVLLPGPLLGLLALWPLARTEAAARRGRPHHG